MEVLFFLKNRTAFIRNYYETASAPFVEIVRKIEAEEPPYVPDFYEHGDNGPAFELEWNEAQDSLQMLGLSCVSLLSDSLKLYFTTWQKLLRLTPTKEGKKLFESGFLVAYRAFFEHRLKLNWLDGPADLDIIEQVILARNRAAHPEDISSIPATHALKDLKKHPSPFFAYMNEFEKDVEYTYWTPRLHISKETLFDAIKQVEVLAEWLEEKMFAAKYNRI
ncbi:hypothetical protein [Chromobacterium haemolyticum]|uniref:hypothetical protein n=1 Tax=Chromobacterium haemolyticum TaxID=394935 RepID=UPI000D314E38|nr:hypothetical protein [Chromobacterium haemolyticum]PTU68634.1 hypothetical protein DBB33_03835 [Chromobacterium haemolyticum]